MIPEPLQKEGLAIRENAPLAERTTLRIGGPARFFVEVLDVPALQSLLKFAADEQLPVLPLGKGSNLLVPDEGFPGVVFVLKGRFLNAEVKGTEIAAGAGVSLMALAMVAQKAGLSGLENLSGIPSSLGGAIRINAGSYGTEIFELLETVDLVSRRGERRILTAAEIPHGYRWTALMERDDVIVGGVLSLARKPVEEIAARFKEVTEKRKHALPKEWNAGSIFKNPPGHFAGKLLEECGLKGRRIGNAQVSPVHANVIVNLGGGTARDVRTLMEAMSEAVKARFGIELVPEIQLI